MILVTPRIVKVTVVSALHPLAAILPKDATQLVVGADNFLLPEGEFTVLFVIADYRSVVKGIQKVQIVDALVLGCHVLEVNKFAILDVFFLFAQ